MKTLSLALVIIGFWFSAAYADTALDSNTSQINLSEIESKILKIAASISHSSNGKLLTLVLTNENPEPIIISIPSLVSPRFTAAFRVENSVWPTALSAGLPGGNIILASINDQDLSNENQVVISMPATGTVTVSFDFKVLEKLMLSAFQNHAQSEVGASLISFSLQFSDLFIFPEDTDSGVRQKLSTPTLRLGKP